MKSIINAIKQSNNIAIFSHIKTDCDAVCSSLALKLGLQSIGKVADVFIDSGMSVQMQDLPYVGEVNNKTSQKQYDLYVCLDNADIERLGKNKYKIMNHRGQSVQIDHHGTNTKYCKLNYVDEKSASTCEILYDFFKLSEIIITPVMARLLLTGIYTDTGKLSYSNTTPKTLFIASKLLGIYNNGLDTVCEPIFNSQTINEFNMRKLAYNNSKFYFNDTVGIITLTEDDFKKSGATVDDTHGLCDILLSVKSIKVAIQISQDISQPDCYFVSVRSKGDISARSIAEHFGGGGHFNASGCKVFDTLKNVVDVLLSQAKKAIEKC